MPTNTALIQHQPAPFTPDDPEALYTSLLARTPAGEDVSQYWSSQWAQYVAGDQRRTAHQQAQELRWFWREWLARQHGALPEPSEKWSPAPAGEVKPMREIPITRPSTRETASPKGDPAYLQLPALWEQGLTAAEIAKVLGKERGAVAKTIIRMVRSGKIEARV